MRLNATTTIVSFTADSPTMFKEIEISIFNGRYVGLQDIVGSF
jgi:hypothetical protein